MTQSTASNANAKVNRKQAKTKTKSRSKSGSKAGSKAGSKTRRVAKVRKGKKPTTIEDEYKRKIFEQHQLYPNHHY